MVRMIHRVKTVDNVCVEVAKLKERVMSWVASYYMSSIFCQMEKAHEQPKPVPGHAASKEGGSSNFTGGPVLGNIHLDHKSDIAIIMARTTSSPMLW